MFVATGRKSSLGAARGRQAVREGLGCWAAGLMTWARQDSGGQCLSPPAPSLRTSADGPPPAYSCHIWGHRSDPAMYSYVIPQIRAGPQLGEYKTPDEVHPLQTLPFSSCSAG